VTARVVDAGLARLIVVAPGRRLDIALPNQLPVALLLPSILKHAGDDLADDAVGHGGWSLRRITGEALDPRRTLNAQGVRDGDILHLTPQRLEWPEPDYDDIVEAIAEGARRRGFGWNQTATRVTGLASAAAVLAAGLPVLLLSGPGWLVPGVVGLTIGLGLVVAGVAFSRAAGDSVAGALIAALGQPYAFLGGLLVLGDGYRLTELGAPHLLVGSAMLLLAGLVGYVGVAERTRLFVAGTVTGVAGVLGGLLGLTSLAPSGAAALVVSLLTVTAPLMPVLSIQLGRLRLPAVPRTAQDLLDDEPNPDAGQLGDAVRRTDELLTGMLLGLAVASTACLAVLVASGEFAAVLLSGIVAAGLLLRARLFPTARQRTALLVAGVLGLTLLLLTVTAALPAPVRPVLLVPVVVAALLANAAGSAYSTRAPSPRLSRWGDILDVLLMIAVVPVACSVLGLYATLRGLAG